jgi:regulatory protein
VTDDEARTKLMRQAIALLARRAFGKAELRRKLSEQSEEGLLAQVLQCLESLGLLNDAEYAYNLALRRMTQHGWGPLRVQRYLHRHGIAPHVVASALDRVQSEVGGAEALEDYIRRRTQRRGLPVDRNGIRRLFQHLQRRGYRDEEIRSALSRMVPAGAWRNFDTGE